MGRGLDGFITYLLRPCAVFKLHRGGLAIFPVAHSEWETPLPIPNRAVKPLSADGTWGATPWESRSPPVLLSSPRRNGARAAASDSGALRRRRAARCYATPLVDDVSLATRTPRVHAAFRRGLQLARDSHARFVLPTGSSPYSPSVAKSISRSTASVSRAASDVFESNMSS